MIWVYAFVPSWAENLVFLNKTSFGDDDEEKGKKKSFVVKQGGRQ